MNPHRTLPLALLACSLLMPATAPAASDLAGGLKAKFKSKASGKQKAAVKFKGLPPMASPGCPEESWIRLASEGGDSGRIALDCERWQARGNRFRYKGDRSASAGLIKLTLVPGASRGKLVIKLKRKGGDQVVPGPAAFIEARLGTGEDSKACGRFTTFARNEIGKVIARGPSAACPAFAGERAFRSALSGETDSSAEAVTLLSAAIDDLPADGLAALWLGMNHLMRASDDLDWRDPTDFAIAELDKASAALDLAVPLLPDDLRVPGWRAAATWSAGTAAGDSDRVALGLTQLREAIELYPLFNTFDFVGITSVTAPGDPLYAEALEYMDAALASGCSPFTDPEVCGNEGAAPHNIEGTGLMFGDIYLKGGRLEDARYWYELGLSYDDIDLPAGDWQYAYLTEGRLADLEGRMALYQDDDPANDPQLAGSAAGGSACAICHYN